jgi:hypothetical protein
MLFVSGDGCMLAIYCVEWCVRFIILAFVSFSIGFVSPFFGGHHHWWCCNRVTIIALWSRGIFLVHIKSWQKTKVKTVDVYKCQNSIFYREVIKYTSKNGQFEIALCSTRSLLKYLNCQNDKENYTIPTLFLPWESSPHFLAELRLSSAATTL